MTERVSIVVPVYNVEKYLDRCVASLVHQTYTNLEIILVNDGSTDSSGSICRKWGGITGVVVVDQENRGVSAARNAGLQSASGNLIMFVDADDWCELNMVETMVLSIGAKDFCYCAYSVNTDKNEKPIGNAVSAGEYAIADIYPKLFFGTSNRAGADMATALWRGMFRKDIIDKYQLKFDTHIRFAEDWLFYADYFRFVRLLVVIDDHLYHYYRRSGSLTHIFNPTTELGIKKSAYILNRFNELARLTPIDKSLYAPYMLKRLIGQVLNVSKNQWDKRNRSGIKQKASMIKLSIKLSNVKDQIDKIGWSNGDLYTKFWVAAIRNEVLWPISIYGIVYNTMQSIRDFYRKVK